MNDEGPNIFALCLFICGYEVPGSIRDLACINAQSFGETPDKKKED